MRTNRMKTHVMKKVISFVLLSCMLLVMLPVTTLANPTEEIHLSTPDDLMNFAENCRVNTWSVGKTVILDQDIDMSEYAFEGVPTFGGTFLGQGHKITGIHLKQEGSVVGFFRYLQKTAKVDGLNLQAEILPNGSQNTVGGFAGSNSGTITNSSFYGVVAGTEQIGGLVGINTTSGLIENCSVAGIVYGNHFVGGLVGENAGVVRKSTNAALINTKSSENLVDIEDITLDSLLETENAGTATDIGGIAGANQGVVRDCINEANIGYQSMGYNIGGIVGTQNGYVAGCINKGDIQGRKEIGGIVGHMEPNIVLYFDQDTLQILDKQVGEMGNSVDNMQSTSQNNGDKINSQLTDMEKDVNDMEESLDILTENMDPENENADPDKVIAATNSLSSSMSSLYKKGVVLQGTLGDASEKTMEQVGNLMGQMEAVTGTLENADENLNISFTDVSREDTEEDTLGKIFACINYGKVKGDMNIGGIAGIMAEENDPSAFQNVETVGDTSLNGTYELRVVLRDCINYGTVVAGKQYAGGAVGQMILGAVFHCINLGNLDSLSADYVGGIAGQSAAYIVGCQTKCVIAGDTYVGGIVGLGKEVKDSYAFIDLKAYSEKAGAILGYTDTLPEDQELIANNFYYNHGKEVGGIDGIIYTKSTDCLTSDQFLGLSNISDLLKTVTITFQIEEMDDTIFTLQAGENLAMSKLPKPTVESHQECLWEVVEPVTYEVLGMGEVATSEYLTEDSLSGVLFDQTYTAVFDQKDTVISSPERTEGNLSILLAEGSFARDTEVSLSTSSSNTWTVTFTNTGVKKLHFLVPSDFDKEHLALYIQTKEGTKQPQTYLIEGSYIVFPFTDGDLGFTLEDTTTEDHTRTILIAVGIAALLATCIIVIVRRKKRR